MKLSETTQKILKNYASINGSLLFKPGSVLKTINREGSVLASAKIEEDIPEEAGIYDLAKFISVISLFEEPNLDFKGTHLVIHQDKQKTKYTYADKSLLKTPPDKEINFPEPDVELTVSEKHLSDVLKAAGVLKLPEIAFVGEDGKCTLCAINQSDPSADSYSIELGETKDTFRLMIKTENLVMIPGDYEVSLTSKGISKFKSKQLEYIIAVDRNSSYTKGE